MSLVILVAADIVLFLLNESRQELSYCGDGCTIMSATRRAPRFDTGCRNARRQRARLSSLSPNNYSVKPKFHYIYLAQNLLKTRFPTSFEQKKSRRPGLRLVCDLVSDKSYDKSNDLSYDSYDKIDLMEFGLYRTTSIA